MKFIQTFIIFSCIASAQAAKTPPPVWTDVRKATKEHPAFRLLGEYKLKDNTHAQVAPLKDGQFLITLYDLKGFQGRGWQGQHAQSKVVTQAYIEKTLKGSDRITYTSPTIGKKAPANAITMPDGFTNVKDGILWAGGKTKKDISSFKMHLEFQLPYKPHRNPSNQDKGNSGIYIYNNYEVQVLDSFGLDYSAKEFPIKTESHPKQWCGCLYKMKMADANMCLPALTWQTYDIEFTAPEFEGDKKVKNAILTVYHNGVKIHDKFELKTGTGAGARRKQVAKGPIIFQDHGNPTAYRNVWIVETDNVNR